MKCLFLTTRIEKPSSRYRILQYIPYYEKEGIKIDVMVVGGLLNRLKVLKKASLYDVVLIQKKLLSLFELSFLRKRVKGTIIYDFDDSIMYNQSGNGSEGKRFSRFRKTVAIADCIIAGNRYLASQVDDKNKDKVKVVPTVVDVSKYTVKDYTKPSSKVTIGWIGTKSTTRYLEPIVTVLNSLVVDYPEMEVKIITDIEPQLDIKRLSFEKWQKNTEQEQIAGFDIGIMPLCDNNWTRGKCAFKIIQYMAAAVPVVCSPVGMNAELVKHGENGFCANNLDEWYDCIKELIEDKSMRKSFGLKGREIVEKSYNLDSWGPYMAKLMKGQKT